ncbi:probable polyketide synthase [Fusarium mangiferae]|uniref:Probable polyketide synthase n=1 Tax=Fusarium mangiferae TaxID=192010 RepID=A0A1L7TTY2_FUSMA|nr:putative polyketide synthase [Fusarium mangiferae]CVL00302.1 probable polyketide synthase [Fusarium mangiferae]
MSANLLNGVNGGTAVNGHGTTNGYTNVQSNGQADGNAPANGTHTGHANGYTSSVNSSGFPSTEPIAICGMSVRLPGGLHSPKDFWDFLISKGDARGPVPESRYKSSSFWSETTKPGTVKTQYGYFLDESIDIASVDTSFFTMRKAEVERADPQQRQMLEVARECLEDAGIDWKGRAIGCYMGSFGEDWTEMFAKETQQYGLYRVTGYGDFMLPNRVSYELDLMGPSLVVRTGCSAALVALHEACLAVSRGDCEGALVGGANLIMAPGMTMAMTEQGVLAPDGSCKTFSADANGYARGEAISAIFIKPLCDAIRDGNPVRAVIRSTASNSDGKGTAGGIQVPNDIAQEAMIRKAYSIAGINDYSQTAFVEFHGTGTSIGDPIETRAVGRVFGPSGGVMIGSVKPNLGHSEGASGLTSLIKAVLALENRTIPPNIKFGEPNPDIPWDACGLSVPTEPQEWPGSKHERVSVNSFGIGGTNAHVILDSARSFDLSLAAERATTSSQLLVFSANGPGSLRTMIANYEDYVMRNPKRVNDLSYTLGHKREHLTHRAFAVASPLGGLTTSPVSKTGQKPNIIMVFTGQGAQWPRMGRALIRSSQFPIFRETIQSLDAHLQTLERAPEWNIEEELQKSTKTSRLNSAELSQPLCTAIQVALLDTFASIGVHPAAVVGHSSGEVAAAYAVGAITANEAITVAFYRGLVTKLQTKSGAMAAIGMGSEEIQEYMQPGVVIACENSPHSVTIAGDTEAVKNMTTKVIKESHPDVMARLLQVDMAYHSHHMTEIGTDYYALMQNKIFPKKPTKLFFSSVKDELLTEASAFGPRYWQQNMESRVLFSSAVSSIIQHDISKNAVFLEVGPHSALAGPLRQIQAKNSTSLTYISALVRHENDVESFLTCVGKLFTVNAEVNLTKVIAKGSILPDLPRYPWNHSERYWYESRLSKEWRYREYKYHDLLGVRVPESLDFEILFRNLFHLDNAPWIRDHRVGDDIVFPFAGYAGMMGEAVRQVTHVDEAFKLRNVIVSTALVLNEGKPVEIMTTLHRKRLTNNLDSEWWEVTIASYNGAVWTKHCSGEARSFGESLGDAETKAPFLRKVGTRRCYESMARSGLNFGPEFQRLDQIKADTQEQRADAKVAAKDGDNVDYHLHPTIIDATLQLLSVAASQGFAEPSDKTMVPTHIDEMCIYRSAIAGDVDIQASASYTASRSITGSGQAVDAQGQLIFRSSGIKLSIVEGQSGDSPVEPTAHTEWAPHIDFLDTKTLIKTKVDRSEHMPDLTELSHLCMVHSKRVIANLDTNIEYMHKYRSWINRQIQSQNLGYLESLSDDEIRQRVKGLTDKLMQTSAIDAAVAITKIFSYVASIFTGDVDALELLLANDTLNNLYVFMDQCDESQFLQYLAHSKPNLRVLEIGAGTGGSTAQLLEHLAPSGKVQYSNYTFTDISSGFFVEAKERFKGFPNMEFATLDISKDLAEQGFDGCKYDLILATNVIHATKSLNESLKNVHQLLGPNGRFLLHELTPTSKWVNYVWGTLAGWWYGEQDGRPDEPYISIQRWEQELQTAGFRVPDAAVLDSAQPHQLNAMIVARPATDNSRDKRVTLLTLSHYETKSETALRQTLEGRGYVVQRSVFSDLCVPNGQDIITVLDDEQPFFENLEERRFESFKTLAGNLKDAGILWITHLSQLHCSDPRFGQVLGISRTLRSEMLLDFATCEVDNIQSSSDRIVDVFERFQLRQEDDTLKPDYEYSVIENTVYVGRMHPFSAQANLLVPSEDDPVALRTSKPGRLDALHWAGYQAPGLKDDDVEIKVQAAGLNFKDVLCAMGIVEGSNGFGLEGAGIVGRVGPKVTGLKKGDRIMFISHSAFSTQVVVSENLCEKIPDDLSFEDAATMPCSILVHSACGGVGISTIQLARMAGATIYATVSNEEKIQYLEENFSLDRSCIFNSRNDSFVEEIMLKTGGKGVDLALNSLSGELLHATWKCIAPFGKMVEIGKRDLIGAGKLDMSIFEDNRSYSCVDLDQLCFQRGEIAKELLKSVIDLYEKRFIHPIRPIKVYNSREILDSFRYMQQGVHLGKIVVSMDAASSDNLKIQPRKEPVRFGSSGSYLLVGGLGGLGRSISTWMVQRGARHLIYLSRSAGTQQKHLDLAQELESYGCRVDFVQGSINSLEDVTVAVSRANGHLKGILQMSMVLCDQSFDKMTIKEWNTVVNPKVKGTWNLHNASLSVNAELDFFILFSSLSGVIGQPGQANYAGANTFLDSFSQYRANLGLPACAIQIGAVEEVGYMAEHQGIMQKLKASGGSDGTVSEGELLDALGAAMTNKASSFCLGLRHNVSLSDPSNRSLWKKDIRMAVFHNKNNVTGAANTATNDELKSFITKAKKDSSVLHQADTAHFLAIEIGKKVFSFLLKPVEDLETSCSLSDLGMDSLVAIEVRQWWKTVFQFDISVLEMMGMGTLDVLGEHAVKGMLRVFHSDIQSS